ncbi:hypothetical protein JCGZ_02853 [Jatropha curcas]|uniref:Uncharacterized protein n=1 Tax=Jatropha curcas TaxID=180498 RepID=A0A067JFL3_JATCU|nr:hypothetical protein JCGZ_02853 [Jatropha curcas]
MEKMIERIVASSLEKLMSEHSSPYLPIEPFHHNGKTYPGLEIFTDVIDTLAVKPKERKLEKEKEQKEEEKTPEKEGVEGHKRLRRKERKKEEREEVQVAQKVKKEEKNKGKVSAKKEEDPTDQVLKAIWACIEESFEEAETPSNVLIYVKDESDCNELSLLFNEMNFNFAYLFDVFPDGSIHRVDKLLTRVFMPPPNPMRIIECGMKGHGYPEVF